MMKKTIALTGLLAFLLLAVLLLPGNRESVSAFGGCEENCAKCHSLQKSEAQEILVKLKATDAKVLEVKMSPLQGLWEVTVDDKGSRGVLYVGFSKKFIVTGSIVEVETSANKTQETLSALRQPEEFVDTAKLALEKSLLMGERKAPIKIAVFTDPDCPFCARLHNELKKVLAERKDIAFHIKLIPLKMHPDAYWKSKTIICEGSLRLLEENFEKKTIKRQECPTAAVDENMRLAEELGITGTPTLVMPDGLVVVGAKDARSIINLAVKHQGKAAKK